MGIIIILLLLAGAAGIVYAIYRTPDEQLNTDEERAVKRWVSNILNR